MDTIFNWLFNSFGSWPWYISRSAGFMSAILLILLMVSGIGHVTGWTYKFIEPLEAWLVHKWIAYALVVMTLVHVLSLLLDHYVKFSLVDIFVPFANMYSNKSDLFGIPIGWLALPAGVLSLYGIIFVVLTSLKWMSSKRDKMRNSHAVSYAVALLVFIHILGTGTDTANGFLRLVVISLFVLLIAAIARRVFYSTKLP